MQRKFICYLITLFLICFSVSAQNEIDLCPFLGMANIIPHVNLNEITRSGVGLAFALGINNIFIQNAVLIIETDYYFMQINERYIESLGIANLAVLAGYDFNFYIDFIDRSLFINPALGAGYLCYVVMADMENPADPEEFTYHLFFDPFVKIQTQISLQVLDDFYLAVIPGYLIFFEQENIGSYITVDLGLKYIFSLP